MKIATWNVNSLNVRLPQVLEWLGSAQPDVLVLQEIKQVTEKFPTGALAEVGYQSVANGQKTYNGVAVISRTEPADGYEHGCARHRGRIGPQFRPAAERREACELVEIALISSGAIPIPPDSPGFGRDFF